MRCLVAGVMAAAALAGGCGDGDLGTASSGKLRVYTSFSLPSETQLVRAQQLALADADGRAGNFAVELVSVNTTAAGLPESLQRADANSRRAGADPRAVAYVGESNSDLTARSITRTNQVGLLHVSPSSTYTGFTKSVGAQGGEPAKFSSSGRRTFARVIPADDVQAQGIVEAMQEEGVREVFLLDDSSVYGTGLAGLVRAAAQRRGIDISADPAIQQAALGGPADVAREMRRAGVRATAYLGCLDPSVASAFFAAAPELLLFTGDCQAKPLFFEPLRDPKGSVRIVAPFGDPDRPDARAFAERFKRRYGLPPEPQAYFAYESMAAVLEAIRRAGPRAMDRTAVRDAFFALRDRDSILGRYSIDRAGDTTLRTVGLFRVRDRRLAFERLVTAG